MHRKLLRVNLGTGQCREEPIPEEVVRAYVGGRGFGRPLAGNLALLRGSIAGITGMRNKMQDALL